MLYKEMKLNFFKKTLTLYCCVMAILSCSEDTSVIGNNTNHNTKVEKTVTFSATADVDDGGSRTYINGYDVLWSAGDHIKVFCSDDEADFALTSGAGTANANFTGFIKEADNYYAVYPNVGSCSGNVISGIEIPATQYAVTSNIPSNVKNCMVATCTKDNMTFAFKNVCAYLTIDIKYPCSSIVLTAAAGDKIAGTFSATVTGGEPTITPTSCSNKITLLPAPGASNIPVGEYKIAIMPGTINSLEIVCNGIDNISATKAKNSPTTVARKSVMSLGTVLRRNGWKEKHMLYDSYLVDLGDGFDVYWSKGNFSTEGVLEDETAVGDLFLLAATITWTEQALLGDKKNFRAPTKAEFENLKEQTYGTVETLKGVAGNRFTSKSDATKSIFLPRTGFGGYYINAATQKPWELNYLVEVQLTTDGFYWSCENDNSKTGFHTASVEGNRHYAGVETYPADGELQATNYNLYFLFAIRPVISKRNEAGL